ncbi:hypothetical protein P7C70_g2503, partial [Phenoliferia sp. Uapishka_3]
MAAQLSFTSFNRDPDPWCQDSTAALWDGLDFSTCFRARVFNGLIPAAFIALSLSSFLLLIIFHIVIKLLPKSSSKVAISSGAARRLSTSSRARRSSISSAYSSAEIPTTAGPMAIAEAENEVILGVVNEESPDLEIKDVLALGVGDTKESVAREHLGGFLQVSGSSAIDDEEEGERIPESVTFGMLFIALWGTKKNSLSAVGSAALTALLVVRLVYGQGEEGSNWLPLMVVAWAWSTLLALAQLALAFTFRLRRLQLPGSTHRVPRWYTFLEIHYIPWLMIYVIIAFFNLRSAILTNLAAESRSAFVVEVATFTISSTLFLVEIFAPRPSKFSSRSSKATTDATTKLPRAPEMNASLFGLATFSYINSFMVANAFPKPGQPALPMTAIPDLRPDDKTARVLLSYRRDVAALNAGRGPGTKRKAWGLTAKLAWHFRRELLVQQFWSYIRVAVVGLPPLFLQAILGHINKRQRGEEAPFHVALLYAVGLFFFQILGALCASQSLFIGRRICIRLRSIIVGEVFTKALRRKDMAGTSAPTDESDDVKKDAKKEAKKPTEDEEAEKASSGKILNLISVDTFRLSEVCAYLHFIWPELSLTIVITVVLLFRVLGLSAIAGLTVLILITPLQAASSRLFYVYQKRLLAAADARLNLATEVIASVRIVKYFAWEPKFLEKMQETRDKELAALWARALTMVAGTLTTFGAPIIVSVATFVFHTKVLHRDLTAETAFTALALFNILRGPLEGVTDMVVNVLQAHVSLKRIDEFLQEQETAKYSTMRSTATGTEPVIGFVDGSFTWSDEQLAKDDPSVFRIHDLNLEFPVGKLSIILGPVGSGKSTLLLSLLGETNKLSGASFLPSPVVRSTGADPSILTDTAAYCSQSPWLLSDTIKENILFGSQLNEARYQAVLDACALQTDLRQFELGDATEVGEKGTVLSGGQKARISLARAIYSPAKHVLLDDVLSAVDSHTAQHLFSECLKGRIMRHRTCIIVTHAVDLCLPGSAYIVSMDNGSIVTSGTPDVLATSPEHKALLAPKLEETAAASAIMIEAIAAGETDEELTIEQAEAKRARQEQLKLVKDETQSEGAVSRDVYLLYLRSMGGWWLAALSLSIFVAAQLAEIGVSLALRYWAASYDDEENSARQLVVMTLHTSLNRWRSVPSAMLHPFRSNEDLFSTTGYGNETTDYWLKMYVVLGLINLSLYAARVAFFLHRGVVASRIIYTELIDKILGARIRFFDQTPTGRILNRLSKDMETIDQDVAMAGMFLLLEILGVIGIIGSISAVLPAFLGAAAIITLSYWAIGYVYLASSRELKRHESVTKSPIFALFGESLNGVATIRAYGDSARFTRQTFDLVNINNRPFFALWQANRWLSVRVDIAGACVSLAAAVFVLSAKSMDAALAGFVLSFAIAFNERILWVVRLWSVVEINFNSVERVREYLQLDQESKTGAIPPAIWPSRDGSIEVEGLTASYAPELPPVLKNVSFKILPKEKIGICGRTGSGKSTLGLSFFRFIEPTSGRIVIDGLDINTLSLPELRSRLTIVAQESALFAGTLRFNVDPFDVYDDADIWDALRRVQMAAPISRPTPRQSRAPSRVQSRAPSIKGGADDEDGEGSETTATEADERFIVKSLEMVVMEGGKNFSAGQRQLLALARGILKLSTSSILLLDESTASLDQATDERIQDTIRTEMSSATILCIAHRLRTIIDYDKILVLDQGEVVEFDTPWNLLARESSSFYSLCQKSGEFDSLLVLANAKRDSLIA